MIVRKDRENPTPFAWRTLDDYLDDLEQVASAQDLGEDEVYIRTHTDNWLGGIKMQIKPAFED